MKIYEIIFSPTGGTKKVADFLAKALGTEFSCVDLSDSKADFSQVSLAGDDIAIVAVPSYSGRVPAVAAARIAKINGNGAKAILVCVYGNRAYEDTLVELQDLVQQSGFSVVSAVAAIAEHSIARRYAAGRPDKDDYIRLKDFAEQIGAKLMQKDFSAPAIPGNRPYRKAGRVGILPKATRACTKCGLCASQCPVSAIDRGNPARVDKQACISCMRCVEICPHQARKVNGLLMTVVNMMLKKACSSRKDCELYL